MALLAGKFEKEAILERAMPLVSGSTTWLKRLVNQLIKRFGDKRPRRREHIVFLLHSRSLLIASEKDGFEIRSYAQAAEFLPSPGMFENTNVHPLRTVADIGE